MRIGVFGIGAIGSAITIALNAKNEYFYFNRSERQSVEVHFEATVTQKEIRLREISDSYELDWLIVCIKEYHSAAAERDIEMLLAKHTKLAVVRNGLDLHKPYIRFIEDERVLQCMIDCPIQRSPEGFFLQMKKPVIRVKKGRLAADFENLFRQSEIEIRQVEDFKTANWKKLIESSAIGGILALAGETVWVFQNQEMLELFERVLDEGIEVARMEGANIDAAYRKEMIDKLLAYPKGKGSSMLTDRLSGRQIEVNAKNGLISSYGKKHQITTELNDLICTLLRYTNNHKNEERG